MVFQEIILMLIKINAKPMFYNKKRVKQSPVQERDLISGFLYQTLINSTSIVIEAKKK